eukprot:TRINITY_DN127_c0_g1_i1.p1 TRINITY_DN127_c0_g1~~TRINITY_DN127_c0_g1_i1.p1  ORF type:complete len:101 (-),score=39.20 TRINITY_DN127_c0_g1_i1:26-328(-)
MEEGSSHKEESTFLSGVVGSRVRVTLVDGRIYVGTLDCVDSEGNISMGESKLYFVDNDDVDVIDSRTVLVRKNAVKKLELFTDPVQSTGDELEKVHVDEE